VQVGGGDVTVNAVACSSFSVPGSWIFHGPSSSVRISQPDVLAAVVGEVHIVRAERVLDP